DGRAGATWGRHATVSKSLRWVASTCLMRLLCCRGVRRVLWTTPRPDGQPRLAVVVLFPADSAVCAALGEDAGVRVPHHHASPQHFLRQGAQPTNQTCHRASSTTPNGWLDVHFRLCQVPAVATAAEPDEKQRLHLPCRRRSIRCFKGYVTNR